MGTNLERLYYLVHNYRNLSQRIIHPHRIMIYLVSVWSDHWMTLETYRLVK